MSANARAASSAGGYDAIVVGAGINSLVSAVHLSRAGWRTLVLERGERPGGAIRSGEITLPGFVHDLYATNVNQFIGSPTNKQLGADLARNGLELAHCAHPFANVFPGGGALRVQQGIPETLAELERHDPRDAAGWGELDALYERLKPALFTLFGTRANPRGLAAALLAQAPALGGSGIQELAQLLLSSTRELGEAYLHSPEAKALLACWGLHLDFAPDIAGGAMIPFLESFTDMRAGISVVKGGASRLIDALVAVGAEHGMELRTGAEVASVQVSEGRAAGVVLASGERLAARRAVVAGVTPRLLYGELLAEANPPAALRRAAARYRYGPGTMMVHLALSRPPRWEAGEDLSRFGYVHIAPYVDDLAAMYAQALAGALPAEPMLIVGQTSNVDPSRAPDGAVLWIQVRALPAQIRGDASGRIDATSWAAAREPYADRVLAKLERYAPGIGDLVLDRAVLSPEDLERENPNLVGGDSIGGSMHLRQNFLFRPSPAGSDYETGVEGLLMVGAGTWPGGGVGGLSGFNAAQKLLAGTPTRREDAKLALGVARAGGGALTRALRR